MPLCQRCDNTRRPATDRAHVTGNTCHWQHIQTGDVCCRCHEPCLNTSKTVTCAGGVSVPVFFCSSPVGFGVTCVATSEMRRCIRRDAKQEADKDKNGYMDAEEFQNCIQKMGLPLTQDQILMLMAVRPSPKLPHNHSRTSHDPSRTPPLSLTNYPTVTLQLAHNPFTNSITTIHTDSDAHGGTTAGVLHSSSSLAATWT